MLAYTRTVLLFALLFCACSTRPAPQARHLVPRETAPIPADLGVEVQRARALGAAIYVQDSASAVATDVLIRNVGPLAEQDLGGWIALRDSDVGGRPTGWWLVQFFSESRPERLLYEVRVPMRPGREPQFERVAPPRPPTRRERALLDARHAAIAAVPPPDSPMNTVILPGEPFGEEGVLVYLLAATTDPGVMVLGKHYRVAVDDDGQRVRSVQPLSRDALRIDLSEVRRDDGERERVPYVKHTLTETPLENVVFASLFHRQPLVVVTSRGAWWVDGDNLDLISEQVPARLGDLLH